MRVIKSGIIAGIIGVIIAIANLFIMMFLSKEYPVSFFVYIDMALEMVIGVVFPGVIAGILSSRNVMNKTESLVPGIVAGAIIAAFGLLVTVIATVFFGPGMGLISLPDQLFFWTGYILRFALTISLSGLCSALAIFFTRELYWSIPSPDRERDPGDLKVLYDALWTDARTMILDMNRSIRVYLFVGFLIIFCGLAILANGLGQLQHAPAIGQSYFDYFIAIFEVAGGLAQFILGFYLLYWYDKLKKRYSRLMQMEKALEA